MIIGIPRKSAQYFSLRPFKMFLQECGVVFFQYLKVIAVRKSQYVLPIWYQKGCQHNLPLGSFLGEGGLRDFCCLSRHKKIKIVKMLISCRDQIPPGAEDTGVLGRGEKGSLERALPRPPPALCPRIVLAWGERMVSRNSEKQAKIACNLGCQEME